MAKQEYAGFWIRFVAFLLDMLIIGIPAGILNMLLAFISSVLSFLISIAVFVLVVYLEGTMGGTPGKLILGLRIGDERGALIGIPKAILRNLGKMVSGMILGIGYVMIGFTEKKQGLHDFIAGTYVVKKS